MGYLDTSQVTNMYSVFSYCTSLTSLDLSNNSLSNISSSYNCGLDWIAHKCTKLQSVVLPDNIAPEASTYASFYGDTNLLSIDCKGLKMNGNSEYDSCPTFYSCTNLREIRTKAEWYKSLGHLLKETSPNYSKWTVASSGANVFSDQIFGNASGDTYTKFVDKKLSDYTVEELTSISNDIATNGQSSQYWEEFNGYLTNAFLVNESTGKPYDNGNTTGVLEDPTNHVMINGKPCRLIGINHDLSNGEAGLTFMATVSVGKSI